MNIYLLDYRTGSTVTDSVSSIRIYARKDGVRIDIYGDNSHSSITLDAEMTERLIRRLPIPKITGPMPKENT